MLCSMCHKNEAVICYTEIINGVKKEQYLCPECAAKYTSFDSDTLGMAPGNLLASLLTSVLGQTGIAAEDDAKKTNLVCPKCGMTYNEFLKYSKFGCPECVHTFGFLLDDYFKKIQGSCEHCGKVYHGGETVFIPDITAVAGDGSTSAAPEMAPAVQVNDKDSKEVASLKKKLDKAIRDEEYEEAARLRDEIRALTAKEAKTGENVV
ncbi:MAG: UvrB/UvrC motif-containing protein [Clostridiales bacterium]|nr:UvrB/UvrC motif-containing protein [Clostridiales bacterium]